METLTQITTPLQQCLHRHRNGDPSARDEIIARSEKRLRVLVEKMMRGGFSRLARWEQPEDVLQLAMIRLHRSLTTIQPETVTGFVSLGEQHIRWTLLDLIRLHYGQKGGASRPVIAEDQGRIDKAIATAIYEEDQPESVEEWTAFHQSIEALPKNERQVLKLIYYDGLDRTKVAVLLGITDRTVRRRLTSAKHKLAAILQR